MIVNVNYLTKVTVILLLSLEIFLKYILKDTKKARVLIEWIKNVIFRYADDDKIRWSFQIGFEKKAK